ncbi:unnamed protein product [Ectocarpus fasciculatus]
MVYFVCESCNETLKKSQVDRHLYSCKSCWGVTCVDCNFTFEGDSYRAHTSCVSEDQKYQGALFKAPKAKQKNRGVNEIWADSVLLAASNASSGVAPKPLCAHLVRMGDLGNVPRQEKKFKNFVKNSLRVFDETTVSKLWDYVDGVKNDMTAKEKEAVAAQAAAPTPAAAVVAVAEVTAAAEEPKEETAAKTEPARKSSKKEKKSKKRARENAVDEGKGGTGGGSDNGSGGSEKRRREKQPEGEKQPQEAAAGEEVGGAGDDGGGVDATTRKALAKAAVGVVKKAQDKRIAVKELAKQAAAAVLAARGTEGSSNRSKENQPDDQTLRRALKQRLKTGGLRHVTVEGKIAVYSKG